MKRLVFIFAFLIVCSAIQANARGIMTMCGAGTGSAASCQESTKQSFETETSFVYLARTSSTLWAASMFETTSAFKACKVCFYIMKTGAPEFNLTAHIYSNNSSPSDRPNESVAATTSSALAANDLTTSYSWRCFNFNNVDLSNSTKYWVILESSTYGDTDNYVRVREGDNESGRYALGADGVTWGTINDTKALNYRVYAYE